MSRRDLFHDLVRRALEKEGWVITHDPYPLIFTTRNVRVDLGAEAPLGAEKSGQKIAVEIKGFTGSEMSELEKALGQFLLYQSLLEDQEPERTLFLAVPEDSWRSLFAESATQKLVQRYGLKIVIYSVEREEIVEWTS